jgi:antirestriction protein ArdC
MNTYQVITEKIIEQLEKGVVPWRKPWQTVLPQNLISRKEYRGINSILLNSLPFEHPYFLTFKQAHGLGGFVRRGEKGLPVVFWQFMENEETKEKFPLLRYYTVFNVSQCDGVPVPISCKGSQFNPIEECDRIVSGMPNSPAVEFGGNQAFYVPSRDLIQMPVRERCSEAEEFYATIFHELVHSTGHVSRLNRKGINESGVGFGSQTYSQEELVAEIGASFLNAKAGIVGRTIANSASYIANWLSALRNDKRMVIVAAGAAQRAADYILGAQALTEVK